MLLNTLVIQTFPSTDYGFHGHLLVTQTGIMTGFCLTAANGSEREALWDFVPSIKGLLIGDKGYLSAPLKAELQQHGIQLATPCRSNMQDLPCPLIDNS